MKATLLDYFWYIFCLSFRYYPIRYTLGLVKIGNPTKDSPVVVSGNYYLTVMKLRWQLKGTNCYLLVVDSAGVNIWCASGAGDFNESKISDAVNTYNIGKLVEHKKTRSTPTRCSWNRSQAIKAVLRLLRRLGASITIASKTIS